MDFTPPTIGVTMSDQILRDRNGHKIGMLQVEGSVTKLYDVNHHFLGEYRADTNSTVDELYRKVGSGNILMTLLRY